MSNRNLEAKIAWGISEQNRAEIKAELKKLPKEERERIAREANEPAKIELAKLIEEIEDFDGSIEYSLDWLEDGLKSRLFRYVLNHGYEKMIETKLKDKLWETIYWKYKTTLELVYFDKLNQVANPKNIFSFFTEKYGTKASNLFAKIFKKDKDGNLDFWALQEGIDETSNLFSEEANWPKTPAQEKLWNFKMMADFFNKPVENYDKNLDKLIALWKGKPWFEELFNNPLVLSKILETESYKENGNDIDINKWVFLYTPSWDIEMVQKQFLQWLLARANDNGKALDYLREKQKTFDKMLGIFWSSVKEILVSILSFFWIWGIAWKWLDFIDSIYGKDDKEKSLEALEKFGNSDAWKNLLSGTIPNDPKKLKWFFRFAKHIKFGNMTEWVNNPNFWSYILTEKDSNGTDMKEVSDEVNALWRIVRGINKVWDKILTRDLVTKLNSITKKDIADEIKKISDENVAKQAKNQAPKAPVNPTDTPPVVQNWETPKEWEFRAPSIQTPKWQEAIPQQAIESPYSKIEISGISQEVQFDKEKQHIIIWGLRFKISSLSAWEQEITGWTIESIVSENWSVKIKFVFWDAWNIKELLTLQKASLEIKLKWLQVKNAFAPNPQEINSIKDQIADIEKSIQDKYIVKTISWDDIKGFIEKLRDNKRAEFNFKDSKWKSGLILIMWAA